MSTASIPNGDLVCEPAPYNCGYGWHRNPDTIEFAEATIELCDATTSYVEGNGKAFGPGYCPWPAELIELRDCRMDLSCPLAAQP